MKTTHELGNVGELRVAYEAAKRGYIVSVPIGHDARYDLLVDRNNKIERVQVKTVQSDGAVVKVLLRSVGKLDGKTISKPYTADEIDWIVVYDTTTDRCAFMPSNVLTGAETLSLRYHAAKNNQRKKVHWFIDYQQW